MSSSVKWSALLLLGLLAACGEDEAVAPYNYGSLISEAEIAPWDIDVGPDGVGLPAGSGTASVGEPIYLAKCAVCHGDFGEGMGLYPPLEGRPEILTSDQPKKSVGSYWPHATTLWDYIYRAMPFGNAQSLSADEVYAITAYILALNNIIEEEEVMDANSLPRVKMPNRKGFYTSRGADIQARDCMHDCMEQVEISSRAGLLPTSEKQSP